MLVVVGIVLSINIVIKKYLPIFSYKEILPKVFLKKDAMNFF